MNMRHLLEIEPGSPFRVPCFFIIAGLVSIFASLTDISIFNIRIKVTYEILLFIFGIIFIIVGIIIFFWVFKSLINLEHMRIKTSLFLPIIGVVGVLVAMISMQYTLMPTPIVNTTTIETPTPIEETGTIGNTPTIGTSIEINITSPTDGSIVSVNEPIYGNSTGVYRSGLHLYVLIRPVATGNLWWSMPEAKVSPDGTWHAIAYFGRSTQEDIGAKFWVTSVVTSDVLPAGHTIYPSEVKSSTKIIVTRI